MALGGHHRQGAGPCPFMSISSLTSRVVLTFGSVRQRAQGPDPGHRRLAGRSSGPLSAAVIWRRHPVVGEPRLVLAHHAYAVCGFGRLPARGSASSALDQGQRIQHSIDEDRCGARCRRGCAGGWWAGRSRIPAPALEKASWRRDRRGLRQAENRPRRCWRPGQQAPP